MKRSTIVLFLVLIGLLIMPFAALADAPAAEPPPGATDPGAPSDPDPAVDAGILCEYPHVNYEDDCIAPLSGSYSDEEVAALYTAAAGGNIDVIPENPYLGVGAIKLDSVLRYLRTGQAMDKNGGIITTVKIHATCKLFMEAERLDMTGYYRCVAVMAQASGDLKGIMCPAIEQMLKMFANPSTAQQKRTLESLLFVQGSLCI